MTLRLEGKKAIVEEVKAIAACALSVIAAEYRGLTVMQLTKLRAQARVAGVYIRVIRNTLARRAVEETPFSCLQKALVGPMLLAFSQHEPSAAARLLRDFSKEHEKLVVKTLAFDGQLLPAKDLDRLASLPTRDEALASLMAVMKAPIAKFVRTLAEPHAKLARTFAAVRDQQQEHGA